jgi:hypothetical protein
MMIRYDAKVFYRLAGNLESMAQFTLWAATLLGAAFGGFLGWAATSPFGNSGTGMSVGLLLGGGIGFVIGRAFAFWYRVQAHMMLCQAQIEENTRTFTGSTVAPTGASTGASTGAPGATPTMTGAAALGGATVASARPRVSHREPAAGSNANRFQFWERVRIQSALPELAQINGREGDVRGFRRTEDDRWVYQVAVDGFAQPFDVPEAALLPVAE